ncbi:MAG: alanine--tRNA ligase [Dehalococcoidia bacterium]
MNAHELREAFQRFFEERGHRRVPGAPIVPPGDPTLLFTSAGMVQFKPYFMGQAEPPSRRMTSVQKCFRTTDIDEVGDYSHLTMFEMLGNFSVGDYFKAEIIPWAWEFVTNNLGLQPERLWAAVYLDDDEAYDLWRATGVPPERIVRYGEEENYWFSGDAGPCGPCSEIYFDFGEQFGCGPACEPNHDCGRFLEIWNLVFMTYYRDGEKRTPLPAKNIDTGSGLERVASVLLYNTPDWDKNRLASVYDTDLFQPLIRKIEQVSGKRYGADEATDRAIRIVAEHARAVTLLVGDERTPVVPSNEERGYVCRRMLRRAVYFGRQHLTINEPFMTALADVVINTMKESYPELERQQKFIREIIAPEEARFEQTVLRGVEKLTELMATASGGVVSGGDAFILHDTYGLPIDLTKDIAAQNGMAVDEAGFEAEMERQRDRARASAGGAEAVAADTLYASLVTEPTIFTGYQETEAQSRVAALTTDGDGAPASGDGALAPSQTANASQPVEIFLEATPFYPEGGGQVGDRGTIAGPNGRVDVTDTQRVAERLIVHRGTVSQGAITVGDDITAAVDPEHRANTRRNHTATHLLHAALRQVLGAHVRQAGSLVGPDHLRFDFTHTKAVTPEQLAEVESLVNDKVRQNIPVNTRETTFDEAMSDGVLAFFGDKYGERVRVVEVNTVVPRFSAELCGGTHCERTGEIGSIIITNESSIGSGMRRIEALSGVGAESRIRDQERTLAGIAQRLNAPRTAVLQKLESLVAENDAQRKKIEKLERSLATAPQTDDLAGQAQSIDGVSVLVTRVEAPSIDALRFMGDSVRKSLPSGVAVLGSVIEGRPMFVALVSKDLIDRGLHAGNILRQVATVAGGSGGGRPDTAQGGGKDPGKIDEALAVVAGAVREMIAG